MWKWLFQWGFERLLFAIIIIGLIYAAVLFPLILEIAAGIFIAHYAILFMTALVGDLADKKVEWGLIKEIGKRKDENVGE
jgi:hypothetical protein